MPSLQILTIPKPLPRPGDAAGALYLTEVDLTADPPDPVEQNDIPLLLIFDADVTGLDLTRIALSASDENGADISDEVSFIGELIGKGCSYSAVVRFPHSGGAGEVTVTVLADSVSEGNPETSVTVAYSDDFPQTDWGLLFSASGYDQIVSVDAEHIYLRDGAEIHGYGWNGNRVEALDTTVETGTITALRLDADTFLSTSRQKLARYRNHTRLWESADVLVDPATNAWTLTEDGRLLFFQTTGVGLQELPMEAVHAAIIENTDLEGIRPEAVSLDNGDFDDLNDGVIWYLASDYNEVYVEPRETGDHYIYLYDAEYNLLPSRRIPIASQFITYAPLSLFYFNGLLFRYDTNGGLYFLDVSVWDVPRPLGAIYPMSLAQGQRLDLFKLIRSATDVVFDVGFEKPDWVSIEDNRYLRLTDDAPIDGTAYVQLRGINGVGSSDLCGCGFYITVECPVIPEWYEITSLTLIADQEVNLLEYVRGADFVEWKPGATIPDGLELVNRKVLRVKDGAMLAGAHPVALRAGTRQGFFADTAFAVNILSEPELVSVTNVAGYEVFIEGIDVTQYLDGENIPQISNNLDWVRLNQFTRGRCVVGLINSGSTSGGRNKAYFNTTNPNSFWQTHHLNKSGYLNTIEVFVNLYLPDGSIQRREFFKGVILEVDDRLGQARIALQCIDSSYVLKGTQISEVVRGIPKILQLAPIANTARETPVKEGRYAVEQTFGGTLLPKQTTAEIHTTSITRKEIQNASEGVTENDTAFLTETEVLTQGGYLQTKADHTAIPALVKTETPHRYLSPQAAVEKLTKIEPVNLSVQTAIPQGTGDAHIRANGNLAFPVETGRILRTPTAWIVDAETGNLYYLLSGTVSDTVSDALVCVSKQTETYQVLYEFEPSLRVVSLASADFDTFAVLVTDTENNARLVTYQQSIDQYQEMRDSDFTPQTELHYAVGVSGQDYAWQGNSIGVRGSFSYDVDGQLLYRYAKGAKFGVARVATDGSVEALFTHNKDRYQNHLNCAFDVTDAGDVVFAWGEGTPTDSTLTIEKWNNGTTEIVFQRTVSVANLTEFDTEGGAWLGVHELLSDGENIYLIVPVSRNGRDISTDAGCILYRYNSVTLQLTALAKYDFVQYGPCMLTKHSEASHHNDRDRMTSREGDIYFVESPAVSYQFQARNRHVTVDASGQKGFLKRIEMSGAIETIGNVYFDDGNAYRGHLPMKGLSFDGDLHFVMGYGEAGRITERESDASRPNNWQWFSFGKAYRYKLPVLPTRGTVTSALTSLATTLGTTLSIDKNIVSLQNRRTRGAFVAAPVSRSDTEIAYQFANQAFPTRGYLLIGSELVRYTGKTATHFTGVSRGHLATDIQRHPESTLITYVHRPIERPNTLKSSEPYLEVTVSLDSQHLYNTIQDGSPARLRIADEASQKQFGENTLGLTLQTTEHEIPWTTFISEQYLERFKDLKYLINVRVQAFFALGLGEIVCFKYLTDTPDIDGYLMAMQVMSVQTDKVYTTIRGRQVTPIITPVVSPVASPRHSTDGAGNTFLVDGAGNVVGWYGDAVSAESTPSFEESSLPPLRLRQYEAMTPVVLPRGVSPIGNAFTYTLSPALTKGLIFNPKTLTLQGIPASVIPLTDYTYMAIDSEGQMIQLTQSIEVTAAVQEPRITTDAAGNAFFADGAGNITRWHGF